MWSLDPYKLVRLLEDEVRQLREEGRDVSGLVKKLRKAGLSIRRLLALYKEMQALPLSPSFRYVEPSDLANIRRLRPSGPRRLSLDLSWKELSNKILGGWLGRCIGCMIGKPVESWRRSRIKERLKEAGEYPLKSYFPEEAFTAEELTDWRLRLTRGRISRVERDDDVDYTVLALKLVGKKGCVFSTEDMGREWLSSLPYLAVYTAERCAYRNLVLGLKPPETAVYLNPYRE